MNAIMRKKRDWENYHERQILDIAQRSHEVTTYSLQRAAVIISLLLFLIYRIGGLALIVLRALFISPKLVRRIDNYRVEEIQNLSPARQNQWQ